MIKVSVIVPVYNVEKYLKKCVESLINQDFREYEIIFINDGSKDNSQKIIDEYKTKFPDIIHSYIKENAGQGSARNLGVEQSKGKYICFVDSDDYVKPNFLSECYKYISENNLDIVVFDFYKTYENKNDDEYCKGMLSYSDDNVKNYIISNPSPCNKMFNKDLWIRNNFQFLEKTIYEDLELIPTFAKYTSKIGYLQSPLYYYLIREGSTMHLPKYNSKLCDIFKVVGNLKENLRNMFKEELEYIYITNLLHGAGLRFIKYKEGIDNIKEISDIMKLYFPNWTNNKYLKHNSLKYKIVCYLIYKKYFKLLRMLLNEK